VKLVSSSLGSIWGSVPNYGCPPIRGRVSGLSIVLPGCGYPCENFLGFGSVVFWGFGVRCGCVKLVSSSLGSICGVSAELQMPTHKGEGSWATHSLTRLRRPLRKFLEVRCGIFFCFGVQCGRVKLVSSSLGSIWGSVPNYGCPPIKGRVSGLSIVLPGCGDPCANFLRSGAVVFWGFGVRCGWVKLVSSSLGFIWGGGSMPNYVCPPIRRRVSGLPIVLPG